MIIFPAIDLKSGQCVRLKQGDFNQETIFNNDPLSVAKTFEKRGATWLHVIDLDGAQKGKNTNLNVIKTLKENTNLKIQVGGGIRDQTMIKKLLDINIDCVILGSFAVIHLDKIPELTKQYPNKIIVSVDAKNDYVTYNGWQKTSQFSVLEFCRKLEEAHINTIVFTDILKDGMMEGPNFAYYDLLQKETNLDVIASGGVSTIKDVKQLQKSGLYGAIIGKALYLEELELKEAIQCSQNESFPV
ncbi:MAG: 1-(5-phosphoribosyl)-5-[(5-phosphoribosylamino)methylideneamino]imidazole-4-carboxamide isomerase [Candidatus Izimaplasma sp.]|nr:1-(5-phosphoribosyl)-5-[(5-phosphoribosylamino)methylideneamino]imidazole-4-carboxamide isomerase [Candidatus Izimaplasma bacterium]